MAQGEKKFSHITVSCDEEDDFVVEAGVRSYAPDLGCIGKEAASKTEKTTALADGETEKDTVEYNRVASSDFDEDNALSDWNDEHITSDRTGTPGTQDISGTQDVPRVTDTPDTQAALDTSDTLKEVDGITLEELESMPMSKMQIAILVVALLMIVVAVVYYFVFM